jgi:GDP-4-dehydro-6-deoxy-D-mannose reductase
MKALLTGIGGFSGSHLARFLVEQGVEVHSVGTRLLELPNHTAFDITSTTSADAIETVLHRVQPDYIFHLAGVVRSPNPQDFYRFNTAYAVSLLTALERTGAKTPTLLVGTAAEVGMPTPEQLPIREDMPPNPLEHYGISKLAQTLVGLAAWKRVGIPVVVARPSNIIGVGMPQHFVVQSFASQIARLMRSETMRGEVPPVLKTGNLASSRDFVDVRDLVNIYWDLLRTPAAFGEVVNVCAGVATPIEEIVKKFALLSGLPIVVETDPALYRPVDVPVHYGSTEKLERLLGYKPRTDLDASLKNILENL